MTTKESIRDLIWLLLLGAVGLAIRLRGISSPLDSDEIDTLQFAIGSWSHTIQSSLADRPHPPLYPLLLHTWVGIFGSSSTAVRSLSLIVSAIFIAAVWLVARRFGSTFIAVVATAICAVSPYFVYYGQQARAYAITAPLSVLSVYAMLRWTDQPKSAVWKTLYGVLCAGLLLGDYVWGTFILCQWLALVVIYEFPLWHVMVLGLAFIPSAGWFLAARQVHSRSIANFMAWIGRLSIKDLPFTMVEFFGTPPVRHGTTIVLAVTIVAVLSSVYAFSKLDSGKKRILLTAGLLAASLPAALLVLSMLAHTSFWAPRQMIGSAAMLALVVAVGLAYLAPILRWIMTAALLVCVSYSTLSSSPADRRPRWNLVARDVAAACDGCRVVAFEEWVAQPLSYHLGRKVETDDVLPATTDRLVVVCREGRCAFGSDLRNLNRVAEFDYGGHQGYIKVFLLNGAAR